MQAIFLTFQLHLLGCAIHSQPPQHFPTIAVTESNSSFLETSLTKTNFG